MCLKCLGNLRPPTRLRVLVVVTGNSVTVLETLNVVVDSLVDFDVGDFDVVDFLDFDVVDFVVVTSVVVTSVVVTSLVISVFKTVSRNVGNSSAPS